MEITTIFLALFALLFVFLSFRVSSQRGRAGVTLGDGGDQELQRAIRAHGNFAEYAPLLLFVMWMIEYNTGAEWLVWLFGLVILGGRLAHAYGMLTPSFPVMPRFAGMIATYAPLVLGAFYLLFVALT